MKAIRVLLLLLFIGTAVSFPSGGAEARPISRGDGFPGLSFRDVMSKSDRAYLGVDGKKIFSIKDMQGTLFIIEIFNTYCIICPKNVPVLNAVYSMINSDAQLRHKVKVVSVATGNTINEAESYKKEYKVLYPMLTDFTFALHKALGNPRVPYTIIVKRHARGKYVVAYTCPGVIDSAESLLNEARKILRQEPISK